MWLVTPAGREAWKAQESTAPEEYRRLLWLIDVQGDIRAIKELLREHSEQLVRDWLRELEQLRFIESRETGGEVNNTIPLVIDQPALKAGAEAAGLLARTGAYLASRHTTSCKTKPSAEATILIVEDDHDQMALADLRISMAGYKVRSAASIEELTRSLLREGMPDLMLLDVMLPDGNGFDVLSKLRCHPAYATLPIIMLTVVSEAAHIAKGMALGADGYVTKPYSKNILVGVIRGVIG